MRRKIVLRPSHKMMPLGVLLFLLGLAFLIMFIPTLGDDMTGWIVIPVVTGGFMFFGIAVILHTAKTKVTIYPVAITKDSAPYGERTFQCNWDEVMDYSCSSKGSFMNMGGGSTSYILTATKAQLKINTHSSYFPRLHSYILSRLPKNAKVNLESTEVAQAQPITQILFFRRSSTSFRFFKFVAFLICVLAGVFLFLVSWTALFGNPPGSLISNIAASIMGCVFLFVGLNGLRSAMGSSSSDSIRMSTDGLTTYWGGKKGRHISWDEMRAVQYLFYVDKDAQNDDDNRTFKINLGPRIIHYYAVIGAEGKVIYFKSTMRDYIPFRQSLVYHAPKHVAISLHNRYRINHQAFRKA